MFDKEEYERLIANGINPAAAAFVCGAEHTISNPELAEDGSIHRTIKVRIP